MHNINLEFCSIEPTDQGCVTTFSDGSSANSVAHTTPHYYVISHRCGYGDNIFAYCFEHDFVHSYLAESLFGRTSPILWGVAHGKEVEGADSVQEEALVQAFQSWIRANQEPILSGGDWHRMKREALEMLG